MALKLETVGVSTETHEHAYTWRDQALYALGIGARRSELDYLYENTEGGLKTYPTYVVAPAFKPVFELLGAVGADLSMVVHGGQTVEAFETLPAEGTLHTVGKLLAVYDLKRFAQIMVETVSSVDGTAIARTEWSIIVRDAGGFGGPRPPKDRAKPPSWPKDKAPDWVVSHETSEEQALLYRLSGDVNPLHADPVFAKKVGFAEGPILHGLCTYGHMARAVIASVAAGDASRLKVLGGQFRKPVWPADTIVTEGVDLGDNKVALRVKVDGKSDAVVTSAWAELTN